MRNFVDSKPSHEVVRKTGAAELTAERLQVTDILRCDFSYLRLVLVDLRKLSVAVFNVPP